MITNNHNYNEFEQENSPITTNQIVTKDGVAKSIMIQSGTQVTVEKDLVSQAEEEDMEALLGTYVFFLRSHAY